MGIDDPKPELREVTIFDLVSFVGMFLLLILLYALLFDVSHEVFGHSVHKGDLVVAGFEAVSAPEKGAGQKTALGFCHLSENLAHDFFLSDVFVNAAHVVLQALNLSIGVRDLELASIRFFLDMLRILFFHIDSLYICHYSLLFFTILFEFF